MTTGTEVKALLADLVPDAAWTGDLAALRALLAPDRDPAHLRPAPTPPPASPDAPRPASRGR
jgi:hypothetical protein